MNSGLVQATEAGLPIVNLDELIPADAQEGINISAQVASDNVSAGRAAGNWVIANIEAGSAVGMIEVRPVAPFIESPVVLITTANLPE